MNNIFKKNRWALLVIVLVTIVIYRLNIHTEFNTKIVQDDPSQYFMGATLDLAYSLNSESFKNVEKLASQGVNLNGKGKEGITPILWCLHTNNYAGLKKLLELGADPNLASDDGYTPVYFAAGFRKDSIFLKVLLDHGGDPNSRYDNDFNQSALTHAIKNFNMTNVELLISYGADLDAIDRTEFTPIISAAGFNQFNIVALLIEKGANYKYQTEHGTSLIKLIEEKRGNGGTKELQDSIERVVKMLEERGVKFDKVHAGN